MFCKYCGKELAEGTKFCTFCGKSAISPEADPSQLQDAAQNDTYKNNSGASPDPVASPARKTTKKRIFLTIGVILAVIVIGVIALCLENGNKYDVLGDLKSIVFESYGSQTLEEAAKASLTSIQWTYSESPDNFDEGIGFSASISGIARDDGSTIRLNFNVVYKYGRRENDPQEVECTLESATVNGVFYDDTDTMVILLDWLYGSDD